jgi:hypothetical protein
MSLKEQKIQLIRLNELEHLSHNYRKAFNKKASPYVLPQIDYVGSFISQYQTPEIAPVYVAIPVKNQQEIIFSVLQSLCVSIEREFLIGLLLDNCTDDTEREVHRFLDQAQQNYPNLKRFDLIKSAGELFESTCENVLFEFCTQEFFMSLQADIYLNDSEFLNTAISAFSQNLDLAGISGRARVAYKRDSGMASSLLLRIILRLPHLITLKKYKKVFLGPATLKNGYFGEVADHPKNFMRFTKKQRKTIYPGEAIIRGPIIWRSDVFRKLGSLNDIAFFLGRDDCDLSLRARINLDKFVAFLPTNSYSIKEFGTTRRERSAETLYEMECRASLAASSPGVLQMYWEDGIEVGPPLLKKIHVR